MTVSRSRSVAYDSTCVPGSLSFGLQAEARLFGTLPRNGETRVCIPRHRASPRLRAPDDIGRFGRGSKRRGLDLALFGNQAARPNGGSDAHL